MVVPGTAGRQNQIAPTHHAFVAVHRRVSALPIEHKAHRVGAMTMSRGHFARDQILECDGHRVRGCKFGDSRVRDAQNPPFSAFAGCNKVRRAPHHWLDLVPLPETRLDLKFLRLNERTGMKPGRVESSCTNIVRKLLRGLLRYLS